MFISDSKPTEANVSSNEKEKNGNEKENSGNMSEEELFSSLPDFNPSTEPSLPPSHLPK